MRALGFLLALVGLVAAGATLVISREQFTGPEPSPPVAELSVEPDTPARPPAAPVPVQVRPIAPEVISVPPVEQSALVRVEDRQPLSPIGRAQDPSEKPPAPTLLPRPLAVDAGRFRSKGHLVELAGIEPTDAASECTSDGVTWPCGIHARTAFRNWLRGRALTCVVPAVPGPEPVVTDCTLGRQNPAEWLATHGWVRAAPEGPYAALEAAARDQRKGLFGPAPALPEPMAITVPELSGADISSPFRMEGDTPDAAPSGG